jgi:hypothetical protein
LIYASYVGFWRLVAADPDWEYSDPRPLHRIAEHIKATLIPPPTRHPAAATPLRRGPAVGRSLEGANWEWLDRHCGGFAGAGVRKFGYFPCV